MASSALQSPQEKESSLIERLFSGFLDELSALFLDLAFRLLAKPGGLHFGLAGQPAESFFRQASRLLELSLQPLFLAHEEGLRALSLNIWAFGRIVFHGFAPHEGWEGDQNRKYSLLIPVLG